MKFLCGTLDISNPHLVPILSLSCPYLVPMKCLCGTPTCWTNHLLTRQSPATPRHAPPRPHPLSHPVCPTPTSCLVPSVRPPQSFDVPKDGPEAEPWPEEVRGLRLGECYKSLRKVRLSWPAWKCSLSPCRHSYPGTSTPHVDAAAAQVRRWPAWKCPSHPCIGSHPTPSLSLSPPLPLFPSRSLPPSPSLSLSHHLPHSSPPAGQLGRKTASFPHPNPRHRPHPNPDPI